MKELEIIYEDADILVVKKPAGIATQTRRIGQKDMESLLKNYRAAKGEQPYIGIVHRLDQPVSGVMVFGKNPNAAAKLSEQVKKRNIGKYYHAVCRCETEKKLPQSGTLVDYMTFDKKTNVAKIAEARTPQAKKAVLDYRIVSEEEGRVCFDITLHTGRHHQIRLQLSHAGYPIIGDKKYGGDVEQKAKEDGQRVQLCSYRIIFSHPVTGKEMDFSAS